MSRPAPSPPRAGPALGALLLRDLVRAAQAPVGSSSSGPLIQPFLLCFVFLYVFPQDRAGHRRPRARPTSPRSRPSWFLAWSAFFGDVPGSPSRSRCPWAQEFGFTREIEDRVQAPCPIWLVGHRQGGVRRGPGHLVGHLGCWPIASVVHAPRRAGAPGPCNWPLIPDVYLPARPAIAMAGLGLVAPAPASSRGTSALMFAFIILPITFLGGTYYGWTRLASGHHRRLALAPNPRADQSADLRERGDAGWVFNHGAAYAPVCDLIRW